MSLTTSCLRSWAWLSSSLCLVSSASTADRHLTHTHTHTHTNTHTHTDRSLALMMSPLLVSHSVEGFYDVFLNFILKLLFCFIMLHLNNTPTCVCVCVCVPVGVPPSGLQVFTLLLQAAPLLPPPAQLLLLLLHQSKIGFGRRHFLSLPIWLFSN